jgi:hypothetical protein
MQAALVHTRFAERGKICALLGMYRVPRRHVRTMAGTTYTIFRQHDGNYGVPLGQYGPAVRTATCFKAKTGARASVAQAAELESAADTFQEYYFAKSPGH